MSCTQSHGLIQQTKWGKDRSCVTKICPLRKWQKADIYYSDIENL